MTLNFEVFLIFLTQIDRKNQWMPMDWIDFLNTNIMISLIEKQMKWLIGLTVCPTERWGLSESGVGVHTGDTLSYGPTLL